jgi:tRNA-dihydrouridine synthase A
VKDGRFGACLMAEPGLVAHGVAAMKRAVKIPVTVKCRIGIDDQDPETALDTLARGVIAAGADALVVHARKAWLNGLSPKQNRDIPPLDYDRVYRLKAALPDVPIIVNGGIGGVAEAKQHLDHVDGVMLGRAAYQDPYILADVDQRLFGTGEPAPLRLEVLDSFMAYAEGELARGVRLNQMTRHILGLFHGQPRARAFRRVLAENAHLDGAGLDVLKAARNVAAGERSHAVAAE